MKIRFSPAAIIIITYYPSYCRRLFPSGPIGRRGWTSFGQWAARCGSKLNEVLVNTELIIKVHLDNSYWLLNKIAGSSTNIDRAGSFHHCLAASWLADCWPLIILAISVTTVMTVNHQDSRQSRSDPFHPGYLQSEASHYQLIQNLSIYQNQTKCHKKETKLLTSCSHFSS